MEYQVFLLKIVFASICRLCINFQDLCTSLLGDLCTSLLGDTSGPVYKSTWRYFTSVLLLTSISRFVIDFLSI